MAPDSSENPAMGGSSPAEQDRGTELKVWAVPRCMPSGLILSMALITHIALAVRGIQSQLFHARDFGLAAGCTAAIQPETRVPGDNTGVRISDPRPKPLHLKVDLALPNGESDRMPLPGTLKPEWFPFVAARWRDMYMHDAVWEDGSSVGDRPPQTGGIGDTGVHVAIDCGGSGNGGFAVFGMERDNLGGGGEPKGQPQGDPIANGWFHNVDWGGENRGDILLRIHGLPAGEYEMTCYHNHWEPQKQKTRNRLDQPSQMPPLTGVRAMPLPSAPLPGYRGWSLGLGTGRGVTSLEEAKDVKVTSVTSDDQVATSVIRFKTDGSNDVLVIIDGGNDRYPDPARKGREGSKGVLNAFRIDRSE